MLQMGWLPLQDAMARSSTNSSHRVVPHTHDVIIDDQTGAQTSSRAIRDVVHAGAVRYAVEDVVRIGDQGGPCHTLSESCFRWSVALFASRVGFDRDRAFYPTVLIVIASSRVICRDEPIGAHGALGVNGHDGVLDCGRRRVQVIRGSSLCGWPATASLMPFTAISWKTQGCQFGGPPFGSRMTSEQQVALSGL